jgi:hypothetical protein
MIVSIHIPKTAGTSLQDDLTQIFGDRLLRDYDDWPESTTPEATANNERRRAAMLADAGLITERYDAIHGHFLAGKYAGVFPIGARDDGAIRAKRRAVRRHLRDRDAARDRS